MARVLLILPTATYRAAAFLEAARRLGVEVVTGSERPQALAQVMGANFIELDLDDPVAAADAIAGAAATAPVDAVVAVDDTGALTATRAAARLGLPHNPPEAVAATRDKAALRNRLAARDVAQPRFVVVPADPDDPGREADAVTEAAAALGFPAVVKPVSLSASRGVIRVDDRAGARTTARRVRAIARDAGASPTEPLLVEAFVAGPELAIEGLLSAGRLEVLAVFDKPDPLDGPYFEETIYVTPARVPPGQIEAAARLVAAALDALGLVEGPIHAEVRLGPGGRAVLIEVAARTIGGRCSGALRFGDDSSLEELVLRHALGLPVAVTREAPASGVMMIPIPRSGRLEAVVGLEKARRVEGVSGVELAATLGRPIEALPEGSRYLGFIFARAATPDLVEAALRTAHRALEIRIV